MKTALLILALIIGLSMYIENNGWNFEFGKTGTTAKAEIAKGTARQDAEAVKKWQEVIDEGRRSWNVSQHRSPIDDSTNVYLTVWSNNEVQGRFGSPGNAKMVVRCKENTSTVYFQMNDLFLADIQSYGNVVTRIDKEKARTYRMRESSDNKALGLWRGSTAIPFIKSLFGHDELLVQITPYNESPVMATFNISNLRTAIKPMREACHW